VNSVSGKVAVVAGGASGIGLAIARRLGSMGARIVLADVADEALRVVADELRAEGMEVLAVTTDVGDPASMEALGERVRGEFGAASILVNSAGIVVTGKAWEIPLADWQRVVGANLWGVIHGIRVFVPQIIESGDEGHVVNVASMAGVTSLPTLGPYVATKHGVVALSEVLAFDLAASGVPVGVTVVCPGRVATHIGRDDKLGPLPPVGRGVISAEDVADAVWSAMSEGRFYVFTHKGSQSEVEERLHGIVEGRAPALRPLPTG
jgi:NAD(P)-dependent dehydrogenase (short-subunit alcohol dehydrogenase family)